MQGRDAPRFWVHSSPPAKRNRVASSPKRVTNCMSIGSPASLEFGGTYIAGGPATLKSGLNEKRSKVFTASGLLMPGASSGQSASNACAVRMMRNSTADGCSAPIIAGDAPSRGM